MTERGHARPSVRVPVPVLVLSGPSGTSHFAFLCLSFPICKTGLWGRVEVFILPPSHLSSICHLSNELITMTNLISASSVCPYFTFCTPYLACLVLCPGT